MGLKSRKLHFNSLQKGKGLAKISSKWSAKICM